jgi:predicted lactoylglutathione lyase
MARQIFVNFAVEDLARSKAFYTALGFRFNDQFTNESGACMVIEDNIFAMLLTRPFFQTFTTKEMCDPARSIEVLTCLSCDSREQVDELVAKAVAAGGRIAREARDHGFMYDHAFEDLDGHIWELVYMAPDASAGGQN